MSKILFFLLIKPLSLLPFSVLYLISDVLYFMVFYLFQYRKKVVFSNLKNAFPQKNEAEIKQIAKGFYAHLCDLVIETIKLFNISQAELIKRCTIINPALIESYFQQGKSLIIPTGHYNNWEMAAVASNLQMAHQCITVYAPLKNQFADEQTKKYRTRFGLELWTTEEVNQQFQKNKHRPIAVFFAADQSPFSAARAYWMTFLNQETGVMLGTEICARRYNLPVLFGKIEKTHRGYYTFEFIPLENFPTHTKSGEITESHTRFLEQIILNKPDFWLWSHRRWKKKKPTEGHTTIYPF